ncbi:MAG: hypothetical protein PHF63_09410 [Herbinix sp.]|nr:hypothetical protein [Herbinix sp.]
MGQQFNRSGRNSGFQYENRYDSVQGKFKANEADIKQKGKDDDLIFEDNTVYEIDRECYERFKRQKRRKE